YTPLFRSGVRTRCTPRIDEVVAKVEEVVGTAAIERALPHATTECGRPQFARRCVDHQLHHRRVRQTLVQGIPRSDHCIPCKDTTVTAAKNTCCIGRID